ncbi:MAG: type II secretion system protein GspM [Gallionella sp.]|nr:type II secretion system protein GspM [Gallionella sp.]
MKTQLRKIWESRAPRERTFIAVAAALLGVALYWWLVQAGGQAYTQLRTRVAALQSQTARLEQQAIELEHLRAAPVKSTSQTDLHTLVQAHASAAGLSRSLVRIEVGDADQVIVTFGAVAFPDWLAWIASLKAQQVRIDNCRIEALSTPGMVSVTATLLRPQPR